MVNIIDALKQVTSSIKEWTDENKVQKLVEKDCQLTTTQLQIRIRFQPYQIT